ncbi:MAG: MBL fold metallo-hydrolase, partial [Calditrichaeota bacterium]|nr:MBL fold metallo-hydrolase [Calditrichota bacterium]
YLLINYRIVMRINIFLIFLNLLVSQDSLEITYFANEGIVINTANQLIVIDGLFREGVDYGYEKVPASELSRIETGRAPYNQKMLILVSHIHADHFDPQSVAAALLNNENARLYSSSQVISSVYSYLEKSQFSKRIIDITPQLYQSKKVDFSEFEIVFHRMRHGYSKNYQIENIAHLINFKKISLLHIGDADMIPENFNRLKINKDQQLVAFLPGWYMTNNQGNSLIDQYINTKQLIAVHVHPDETSSIKTSIRRRYEFADAFIKPLEKRIIYCCK